MCYKLAFWWQVRFHTGFKSKSTILTYNFFIFDLLCFKYIKYPSAQLICSLCLIYPSFFWVIYRRALDVNSACLGFQIELLESCQSIASKGEVNEITWPTSKGKNGLFPVLSWLVKLISDSLMVNVYLLTCHYCAIIEDCIQTV